MPTLFCQSKILRNLQKELAVNIPYRGMFALFLSQEIEDYDPDTGIRLNLRVGLGYFQQFESLQEVEIVRSGYADAFDRMAKAAAEKFVKYSDCERLFLVQFFGDDSSYLPDDEIVEIIETAQLPEMIDQVWLAGQEWISESDYEIVWKRIR